MSGIAGIYYRSGRQVKLTDLEGMVASIKHRGPDVTGLWHEGAVGLGNCMLRTTSESLYERMPVANQRGDLMLTADARLDNRDELIVCLRLADRRPETITDSDLIMAAYECWGADCTLHLLGDFAFALWDARKQTLFCARDHFGVKPFYYHWSGSSFVFGSEIRVLLCLAEVPQRLNEAQIAAYLATLFDDAAVTFYRDIQRLPPAHSLTVGEQGIKLWQYWRLDPEHKIALGSDDEYAAAFLEIFSAAIRCRLRSALPAGTLLSGGLDSSSIACVARNLLADEDKLPLPTFSAIFDEVRECDERQYIEPVLAQGGFEPHFVHGDRRRPLEVLDHFLGCHPDEPVFAPGMFQAWDLFGAAQERGLRVLLDGHGGDETVSDGWGYFQELARAGHWAALGLETRAYAKRHNISFGALLWPYLRHYGLIPAMRHRSPLLRRAHRAWRAHTGHRRKRDTRPEGRPDWYGFHTPELVARSGLVERFEQWQRKGPEAASNEHERHFCEITQEYQSYGFEILDKLAIANGIEVRCPFWDRRLVEFCVALPGRQKLHGGWGRYVLRRAMEGILPPEVQWRSSKVSFYPNLRRALLQLDREGIEVLGLDAAEELVEYVDLGQVREASRRCVAGQSEDMLSDLYGLSRVAFLNRWLQTRRAMYN